MNSPATKIPTDMLLDALDKCPYTAYRIASESGLSITAIANYQKRKQKPSKLAADLLDRYLRVREYQAAADRALAAGQTPEPYEEFIKRVGYLNADAVANQETAAALRGAYQQPGLFPAEEVPPVTEKDEYLRIFLPLKNELEAAHNLISVMHESNDFLMSEVSKLRALLFGKQ